VAVVVAVAVLEEVLVVIFLLSLESLLEAEHLLKRL